MQDQTPKTQPNTNASVGGVPKPAPAAPVAPAVVKPVNTNPNATRTVAQQNDFMRKISEKIKGSENILVALSRDPSVDEMAAALGLTMFLDGLQKHTTAIFSGQIPNALQFLQPEETFEANTDSLQDFIIALDKNKADHLRYKLDGDFVKIYITPYKTLITQDDLEFSRGDFNVDLVVALGVPMASELDEALAEHGRIMHDAMTVDITTSVPGRFGEIEWSDPGASSVSEMVTRLIFAMRGQNVRLDKDVATALLTGIVAATGRFSNDRTTSETLEIASKLMSMGADQQLIASNVMDNKPAVEGSYSAPLVEPTVGRENLLVGKDYDSSALADTAGSVVVQPTLQVTPEVAAELQANAARAAAAKAAVSDAVSSAAAEAAATGASGVAMGAIANGMNIDGTGQIGGVNAPEQSPAPTRPVLTEAPMAGPVAVPEPTLPPVMIANAETVPDTEEVQAKDYGKMMAEALAEAGGAPAMPMMPMMGGSGQASMPTPTAPEPMNNDSAPAPEMSGQTNGAPASAPEMPVGQPNMTMTPDPNDMVPGAAASNDTPAGVVPSSVSPNAVPVPNPNLNPAASAVPAEMTGEPVSNPGFIIPPPPAPTPGDDMMPPVLPQVQM